MSIPVVPSSQVGSGPAPLNRRRAVAHICAALGAAYLPPAAVQAALPHAAQAASLRARTRFRQLHSFRFDGTFHDGGAEPHGGLIRANDGFLYGTSFSGGRGDVGAIFRMVDAHTVQTVHNFEWGGRDVSRPSTPLVQASDGALYAASVGGGDVGWGTIYRLTPHRQVEIVHSQGPGTGHEASSGMIQASDGHLYGVMRVGGAWGHGTVFRLRLNGQYEVLHDLLSETDGGFPDQPLVQGPDGHLYGAAAGNANGDNFSTILRVTLDGQFSVVRTLVPAEGYGPGQLVSADGYLFGTCIFGGIDDNGTFFRMKPDGSDFTVLHTFVPPFSETGRRPSGPLMQASDGHFYCTYSSLGDLPLLMRLTKSGGARVLHTFPDSCYPTGTLLEVDGRSLLGLTRYGGDWGRGSIYRVTDAHA